MNLTDNGTSTAAQAIILREYIDLSTKKKLQTSRIKLISL